MNALLASLLRHRTVLLAAFVAAGCATGTPSWSPAGSAPASTTPVEAGELPALVTPSRPPRGTVTATGAVVAANGSGLGAARSPGPGASPGAKATPRPTPTPQPTPTPAPRRVDSAYYFFDHPHTWTLTSRTADPETVVLGTTVATGTFKVVATTPALTLKRHHAAEEEASRGGLILSSSQSLDQVAGFQVIANKDMAGGRLYQVVRGAVYRERFFALIATWDRRSPDAERVEREVRQMVASFKWL